MKHVRRYLPSYPFKSFLLDLSQDGMGKFDNEKDMEQCEKAKKKEYRELLKKYRNAESDRKSYAKETAAIIKK